MTERSSTELSTAAEVGRVPRLSEGKENTVESINFYFADPVAFSFFFLSASASFSFSMTSTNLSTSSGCSI